MPCFWRSWRRWLDRRVTAPVRRPSLEGLEDRTLLSTDTLATATVLQFTPSQNAQSSSFLSTPNEVELFEVQLKAGDQLQAAVSAQNAGSGLQSALRVFNASGSGGYTQLVTAEPEGGDPELTFQATTSGNYFIGVSSAGDDSYNPTDGTGRQGGQTIGLFTLNLQRTPSTTLQPNVTGSAFTLTQPQAVWGGIVTGSFTLQNRGGLAATGFSVALVLSSSTVFNGSDPTVTLTPLPAIFVPPTSLDPDSSSAPVSFSAVLPSTFPAGFARSGPVYVGLVITPGANDTDAFDKSGVHRGLDWETLTVLTPVPAGVTDLSQVDAGLNTLTEGSITTQPQVDKYSFTVTPAMGSGELTAEVTTSGGTLEPRLTLEDANGQELIQSDSGTLLQNLQPGTYSLSVSAQAGTGSYQLISEFAPANPTISLIAGVKALAVADLNGDGIPDIVTANYGNDTVSVLLGNGNGTFQPPLAFPVGSGPDAVAVADLNGATSTSGKPIEDVVVANKNDDTVSVLLGNGGTFQTAQTFAVGAEPDAVAIADLGNGHPGIVTANYGAGTVSVLLGNGDGTFQPAQTFAVGSGPDAVALADLTGDGIFDIVTANAGAGTVSVLLGNGNGSFQPAQTYTVGKTPKAVAVADLGNGHADIVTANSGAGTVSVLLGNGGTFQPAQTYTVGDKPEAVTIADLNGDGIPDIVTANYGGNTVSVLFGNGGGTFTPDPNHSPGLPAGTFSIQNENQNGTSPDAVAVADLNGDGILDIVTANYGDSTLSVLLGKGNGTFKPDSTFCICTAPFAVAVADLNGDGIPDIVTASYCNDTVDVLLGNGNGTFQKALAFPVGPGPDAVAVADLNGDGIPDIVTANYCNGTVSVLLGNGNGSFQPALTYTVGSVPFALAVADLGNGHADIVTANEGAGTVSVLLGNGNGTFQPAQTHTVGKKPEAVAIADLNGDGIPDIVTANYGDNTVSVLLGKGDGTFNPQKTFQVPGNPRSLVLADVNGDGRPDLVVSETDGQDSAVSVLLGNGNGSFQPALTYTVGDEGDEPTNPTLNDLVGGALGRPNALAVADLNGDGIRDIVTANYFDDTMSVLLGNGDGTFQKPQNFPIGPGPSAVAVADLNGDGIPDIVTTTFYSNTVSVLLGNGDGTFQDDQTLPTGSEPDALAKADLTSDGRSDLVIANRNDNTVSVLLGNGDGTFQNAQTFTVGKSPEAVAVADLNDDGRPDIVTANYGSNTVSVLLGNGDGTFQPALTFPVGAEPDAVAVADLNGDGIPDIVTANYGAGTVSVLLGNGDGTFQQPLTFAVGSDPDAVAVADLNGAISASGKPIEDLVVANSGDDTVSVLLGNGNGTFQKARSVAVGSGPDGVAVENLGNGHLDIVTANGGDDTVTVLLGNGGTFQPAQTYAVGGGPFAVAVADLTGNGIADIVTANDYANTVSVLMGNGDGTFQDDPAYLAQHTFPVGSGVEPDALAVADLGNGQPDIVTANFYTRNASVLLGNGDGTFTPATTVGAGLSNTPLLVDLNGDYAAGRPILDSVIVDNAGDILFRQGVAGSDDQFDPPVILNPGTPASDIAVVKTAAGFAVASADAASPASALYTVSLYTVAADGQVTRTTAFSTTLLPTSIVAGDLTGNGLDDIVVTDALDNSIQVSFQQANGTFSPPITLATGVAPSNIQLADVNGDRMLDIVVTDQASGDVTVLLNDARHSFVQEEHFVAGTGLSDVDRSSGPVQVSSLSQSISLVAGDFTGDGLNDLVVVNRGAHSFSVLVNDGNGGFSNPQATLTTSTSDSLALAKVLDGPISNGINEQPGPVVAGYFNGPTQPLDLAILMEDTAQVWIYTNDGQGHFTHTFTVAAGSQPTGLTVVPDAVTGFDDLLVGDPFGDVLRLLGNGNGTFQPPPPLTGDHTALDVTDVVGTGQQLDALVANQQDNRVTVQATLPTGTAFNTVQTLTPQQPAIQLAPGDVHWYQLEGPTGQYDAVVMASGSNSILVYHTASVNPANGEPAFRSVNTYDVGTDPVSVTIADLNGDGIPDMLIVNKDSNDISILMGSYNAAGQWVGTPGPRLASGGTGPVSAALLDLNGLDGTTSDGPDLVVTNADGTISVLPGRGLGFFDDQASDIKSFQLGSSVSAPPTFVPNSDVGYVVTTAGSLLGFNLSNFAGTLQTVFSSAAGVVAAQALEGSVVALMQSGQVDILQANATGQLEVTQSLTPLSGNPSNPSALDVLVTDAGLRAYATSDGQDNVFVYGVGSVPVLGAPGVPLLGESETGSGAPISLPVSSTEVATLAEASTSNDVALSLVVFLVPGGEGLSEASTRVVHGESARQLGTGAELAAAEEGLGASSGGGDEGDSLVASGRGLIGIDLDGLLHDLDLRPQPGGDDTDKTTLRPPNPAGTADNILAADALPDLPLLTVLASAAPATSWASLDPPPVLCTANPPAAQPIPVASENGMTPEVAARTADTLAEPPAVQRFSCAEGISTGDHTPTPPEQPLAGTSLAGDRAWVALLETLAVGGVAWWMGLAQPVLGMLGEEERDDFGVRRWSPSVRRS